MATSDRWVRRVLLALAEARQVCPRYGRGLAWSSDVELGALMRRAGLTVHPEDLGGDVPAILVGPLGGCPSRYRLVVDRGLHRRTRDGYLVRHEIAHILADDASVPTWFQFDGPLPEAELVADVFAFMDLIGDADLEQGDRWAEAKVSCAVGFPSGSAWYLRVPRIVRGLRLVRRELRNWRETGSA